MDMKWHPIEAGSMKGVPRDKDIIFTLLNEDTGEVYTAVGKVDEHILKKYGFVMVGVTTYPFETELFKAWAELPEPFKLNDCNKCAYWNEWTDEFGDGFAECELHKNVPFTKIKFWKCPLEK